MIPVANRLELFVSPYLIDSLSGVSLKLHQPRQAERVMTFDQPWEGPFSGISTILHDGEKYLFYYRGQQQSTGGPPHATCVATSTDGITFHKPELGLCEYGATRKNNTIFVGGPEPHAFAPFVDNCPGVPEGQRFKALAQGPRVDKTHQVAPLYAWQSADGLRWSLMNKGPVLTRGTFDSQNVAFWSTPENRYVAYYRTCHGVPVTQMGGGPRTVTRATSDDFIHWSDPIEMDYGDTLREEIYYNQTFPYFRAPHQYIALGNRIIPDLNVLSQEEGQALGIQMHRDIAYWKDVSEGIFMTTRAGSSSYDRTFMEAYIRPGRLRANWSSRCNMATHGIVQTAEDELSLYYHHCYASPQLHLRRYTLRLDGFASVNAPYQGGTMCTQPLVFSGSQLILNCATSAAGSIRVECLNAAGHALPGFTLEDCVPFMGDCIEHSVRWKSGQDLAGLVGKPVRLRYAMRDADLFSQRFR